MSEPEIVERIARAMCFKMEELVGQREVDKDHFKDEYEALARVAIDAMGIDRLVKTLELVRDWHDGNLEDNNWDKIIQKVRDCLVGKEDRT
jgi:hypothetical protein